MLLHVSDPIQIPSPSHTPLARIHLESPALIRYFQVFDDVTIYIHALKAVTIYFQALGEVTTYFHSLKTATWYFQVLGDDMVYFQLILH